MGPKRRVQLEPAYLLHQRDYRDSSRIIEFFARDHGRVCLFAKGARRPQAALGAVLQPFAPLLISWSGPGDGGTLTGAERAPLARRLGEPAERQRVRLVHVRVRVLAAEEPEQQLVR